MPNDEARFAWIITIIESKRLAGVFQHEAHYTEALGRRSKYLPLFLKLGLVVKQRDRSLLIRSHDRWQSDAPSAAARAQRYRDRKKQNGVTTP